MPLPARRHVEQLLRRHSQNRWEHSGTPAAARAKEPLYKISAIKLMPLSCPSRDFLQSGKKMVNFFFQRCEFKIEHRLSRVQHYVHGAAQPGEAALDSGPHSAANPVSLHSAAQHFSHGKSYSGTRVVVPLEIEGNHVSRKPLLPCAINGLKISMLEQPRIPGKPLRGFCA